MKKALFILSIIVFMILSACSKKSKSSANVEIIDGIENVHNTKAPLHPNKTATLELDLKIGGEDEDGNIILYEPGKFVVDEKENIYINDTGDMIIKVFDKNGQFKHTIGGKGTGPGEFQNVEYMTILPDGGLLTLDIRARRTSVFDDHGEFRKSHQWRNSLSFVYLTTDSSYLTKETVRLEKFHVFIKEFDFSGKELRSYGEFTQSESKLIREAGINMVLVLPHTPHSIFAGDQKRQFLYHCINNQYTIDVYDKSGKIIRKIHRTYEPIPSTDEDAEEFYKIFENSPNPMFLKIAKKIDLPKIKTIANRMIVDNRGNLWIETNEKKKENEIDYVAYDVFNKDGYYDSKIWLDRSPDLFAKGKMYKMETEEETGLLYLKRYYVIWSE
jgi:hypothetical protein